MEVICMETTAFYELVDKVATLIRNEQNEAPFKWVTQERAMQMLDVASKTTMQKLRDEGKIRFSQPARKIILYDKDSIDEYLESNAREAFGQKRRLA